MESRHHGRAETTPVARESPLERGGKHYNWTGGYAIHPPNCLHTDIVFTVSVELSKKKCLGEECTQQPEQKPLVLGQQREKLDARKKKEKEFGEYAIHPCSWPVETISIVSGVQNSSFL